MTVVNKILQPNNSKVNIYAATCSATSDMRHLRKHLLTYFICIDQYTMTKLTHYNSTQIKQQHTDK